MVLAPSENLTEEGRDYTIIAPEKGKSYLPPRKRRDLKRGRKAGNLDVNSLGVIKGEFNGGWETGGLRKF